MTAGCELKMWWWLTKQGELCPHMLRRHSLSSLFPLVSLPHCSLCLCMHRSFRCAKQQALQSNKHSSTDVLLVRPRGAVV